MQDFNSDNSDCSSNFCFVVLNNNLPPFQIQTGDPYKYFIGRVCENLLLSISFNRNTRFENKKRPGTLYSTFLKRSASWFCGKKQLDMKSKRYFVIEVPFSLSKNKNYQLLWSSV